METNTCSSCFKPKANFKCALCESTICKKCTHFISAEEYSFFKKIPDVLTKEIFCHSCYVAKVEPVINRYNDIMEKAKEVYVFDDTQGKESREFSRLEDPIEISDCPDREETLLRMAFQAAAAGFNGLVDVSISSEKVRNHAFQTLKWRGSGIPTNIDPKKLNRNKAFL